MIDIEEATLIFMETRSFAAVALRLGYSREYIRQILNSIGYENKRGSCARFKLNKIADEIRKELIGDKHHQSAAEIMTRFKISKNQYYSLRKIVHFKTKNGTKYPDSLLISTYHKADGNYEIMAEMLNICSSSISRLMKERNLRSKYPAIGLHNSRRKT